MTVTHYNGNRNIRRITDREGGNPALEPRNSPGKSDTDEWKALETDRADSGESIFDLEALDDSDFELDVPSGKPMRAADNQATRDCGCQ